MAEMTMEELLASANNNDYKKGDIVEATVVAKRESQLVLSLEDSPIEAYMYNDQYTNDANEDVSKVKIGDKLTVQISKKSGYDEESQYVLVSRLPLLSKKIIDDLTKVMEEKSDIDAVVKKVIAKGLICDIKNVEVFVPQSLVDIKPVDLNTLANKTITIKLVDKKENNGKITFVGNRKDVQFALLKAKREQEANALNVNDIVKGKIVKFEPYGISVQINELRGVLKYEEVTHYRDEKAENIVKVNDVLDMKIIAKDGNKINLSIKALVPSPFEIYTKENELGATVKGTVAKKIPAGLIIELARGVQALLHKSEYSWNPNDNLDMCVKIGDELEAKIIKIDAENNKISLSRKVLIHDPWKNVDAKKGDEVKAIVKEVTNKGINVLALGVEGFIPSNLAGLEKNAKVEDYFAENDEVTALIYDINKAKWILTLSIKAYKELQERKEFEKYQNEVNDVSNATIGDIVNFKKN